MILTKEVCSHEGSKIKKESVGYIQLTLVKPKWKLLTDLILMLLLLTLDLFVCTNALLNLAI